MGAGAMWRGPRLSSANRDRNRSPQALACVKESASNTAVSGTLAASSSLLLAGAMVPNTPQEQAGTVLGRP